MMSVINVMSWWWFPVRDKTHFLVLFLFVSLYTHPFLYKNRKAPLYICLYVYYLIIIVLYDLFVSFKFNVRISNRILINLNVSRVHTHFLKLWNMICFWVTFVFIGLFLSKHMYPFPNNLFKRNILIQPS